jgi:hypothetical protein
LTGLPLPLHEYRAQTITNPRFGSVELGRWDRFFLPSTLAPLVDDAPLGTLSFVEDDNRSAILPEPAATIDGRDFFLSVKGVGSQVDPFSLRRLDPAYAAELSDDPEVRARLRTVTGDSPGGIITGELWLRGSPYGGQGLLHAETALKVSERAELTSVAGFRIAPVVKIALLPRELESRLRTIHWYRKFPGRLVQEIRLVPSNIRIYFHGRNTVGSNVGYVFDAFGIDSSATAVQFETQFVRSAVAMLTLFARTLTFEASSGQYAGLDFLDVWLDKDAVLAPDGTVFFVDLEGIEAVRVDRTAVVEKIEDQIYRSLYEFMFAYEQLEQERTRRFGGAVSRKRHFEDVLTVALREDPFVRVRREGRGVVLEIRNSIGDEKLNHRFPLVDAS